MTPRSVALAALGILVATQSGCAFLNSVLQRPNVSVRDVKITDLSFSGIGVNFVLGVDNPNPIGMDLATLGYQITVDGHQFAAGQANQAVSIPAQGSGVVNLPLSIKFADFVQSIESLFQKPNLPYTLATNLGFNSPIGVITVPLATSGTFPVPRLPDVQLGQITMGGIDFSGATINLGVNLTNQNAFALPLGTLDYKVSIGGSPIVQNAAQPGTLAPNGRQSLPLAVRVNFLETGRSVYNAIRSGTSSIAFDGGLDLGFYKYPIHLQQRIASQ